MATWKAPQEYTEWVAWLATGIHGRSRWRLPVVLLGMLFGGGRRTVTSWLRAAGVDDNFSNYYYFIAALGRRTIPVATRLLSLLVKHLPIGDRALLVLDDTPTKRYGPKVQGAGIHHNPTPGPTDQKFLYGHNWVTLSLSLRHSLWNTIALPLIAGLYVRQIDLAKLPKKLKWKFATKLVIGARLVEWAAKILQDAGKTAWVVADGAYAKRPFLRAMSVAGVVVVSRLRKDAALWDLPPDRLKAPRGRGRPRKYGKHRISLAKRAAHAHGWQTIECFVYGKTVTKTYKTFLATTRPADGAVRVVLVKNDDGTSLPLFCTDTNAGAQEIIEAFGDRASIEQDFHDLKEVWGAGQQQVRTLWANIGCYHLNLWSHTLVELWAWKKRKRTICDRRASPWDDADRRPSHADRCKALRQACIQQEYSPTNLRNPLPRKITRLLQRLKKLVA